MSDIRLVNEIKHGHLIAAKGEEVWHWSSPAGKVRFKRRSRLFTAFIGNGHKKVLEIGCGTGIFTQELARTKNAIFAVDISSRLLILAKKRVKSKNVKFVLVNAYKTNFSDDYFDYIVGSSVLHHLDIDLSLSEIHRLLKPGGKFMFTEPNMLNPQIALERNVPLIRKLANNSPDETALIRWTMFKKLLAAGFNHVNVKNFDFLHPQVPPALVKPVSRFGMFLEKIPLVKEISGSVIITGQKESGYQKLTRHRRIWQRKKVLRDVYLDFYRRIEADLISGKTLEIGSGSGGFKQYRPSIVASDIVKVPWLDMVFDAHAISLAGGSVANLVLIDVFHHLADPGAFLNEAYRVLKSGGRLILNEPYPSSVSLLVYRLFHPEPFIFDPKKHPVPINQAVAYLFFFKRKIRGWEKKFKILKKEAHSLIVYPFSGGYENKQLVPDGFFPILKLLEKVLTPLKNWLAFRCYVVLEKR